MAKLPPACTEIQTWLYDYLRRDINAPGFEPFDFPMHLIQEWAEEEGVEGIGEEWSFDELPEEHHKPYVKWLRGEIPRLMRDDPTTLPAYTVLHAEAKLPRGTWLAHFTRERGGFDAFDRGTPIEGMHLSTWRQPYRAKCPNNLSPDLSTYEVIFGFAVQADMGWRDQLSYSHMYGKEVVLFQCDCAVEAYHDGDEQTQVIFPICSEYNVVPFYSSGDTSLVGTTETGDEIEFDDLAQALDYVRRAERPAAGLGQRGGWPRLRRLVRR
jgi:hypothetical protein